MNANNSLNTLEICYYVVLDRISYMLYLGVNESEAFLKIIEYTSLESEFLKNDSL